MSCMDQLADVFGDDLGLFAFFQRHLNYLVGKNTFLYIGC